MSGKQTLAGALLFQTDANTRVRIDREQFGNIRIYSANEGGALQGGLSMPQSSDFCQIKAEECERRALEAVDKDVRRVLLAMRDFWLNAANRRLLAVASGSELASPLGNRSQL